MNKSLERRTFGYLSKKATILILLLISFLMTSSTFAYWANVVEGTRISLTNSFIVGSYTIDNQEFVLNSQVTSYRYQLPLDYLLENPQENIDDIIFGLVWNDESLSEEMKDQLISGDIELTYSLILTNQSNKEINSRRYERYSSLINIVANESNPTVIGYNESPLTTKLSISLNPENRTDDYLNLADLNAYIVIRFNVNYTQ